MNWIWTPKPRNTEYRHSGQKPKWFIFHFLNMFRLVTRDEWPFRPQRNPVNWACIHSLNECILKFCFSEFSFPSNKYRKKYWCQMSDWVFNSKKNKQTNTSLKSALRQSTESSKNKILWCDTFRYSKTSSDAIRAQVSFFCHNIIKSITVINGWPYHRIHLSSNTSHYYY